MLWSQLPKASVGFSKQSPQVVAAWPYLVERIYVKVFVAIYLQSNILIDKPFELRTIECLFPGMKLSELNLMSLLENSSCNRSIAQC